jgi:hypothetical protein
MKLLGGSRVVCIDFKGFQPMFRLEAARYRNAIPRVSRLSAPSDLRACLRAAPGVGVMAFSVNPSGGFDQRHDLDTASMSDFPLSDGIMTL